MSAASCTRLGLRLNTPGFNAGAVELALYAERPRELDLFRLQSRLLREDVAAGSVYWVVTERTAMHTKR